MLVFFHIAPIDMNKLYSPCVTVPVIMYHHIQDGATAKKLGQGGLSVSPDWFRKQMEYVKAKGYTPINLSQISDFFDSGTALPKKPIAITLDDAYEDNYLNAYPVLKDLGIKATIFTPTGLVTVMDYLNWGEINEMSGSGLIYFANHTWSHHASSGSLDVLDKEIRLADSQLAEKDYNQSKIFAYPYGKPSIGAESVLTKYSYKLAFTTNYGRLMCKGKRFELPRIRIGNAPLVNFGL